VGRIHPVANARKRVRRARRIRPGQHHAPRCAELQRWPDRQ
jgi:hypothetical protein